MHSFLDLLQSIDSLEVLILKPMHQYLNTINMFSTTLALFAFYSTLDYTQWRKQADVYVVLPPLLVTRSRLAN